MPRNAGTTSERWSTRCAGWLAGTGGRPLATATTRLPAMADGVSAVPALGRVGMLRGDGERHAVDHPGQPSTPGSAQCGDSGWAHAAEQLRERGARGLRRLQEASGQQGAHGRGYAGPVGGQVLASLHFVVFAILMHPKAAAGLTSGVSS